MTNRAVPSWSDKDKVDEFIEHECEEEDFQILLKAVREDPDEPNPNLLDAIEDARKGDFYMLYMWEKYADSDEAQELIALREAKAGNFHKLADMLKRRAQLTQESYNLMAARLKGEYSAGQGQPKKQHHERSQLKDRAKREYRQVQALLRRCYSTEPYKDIIARAKSYTAKRLRISEDTLSNFISK